MVPQHAGAGDLGPEPGQSTGSTRHGRSFGDDVADFRYGLEYRRETAGAAEIGLDDWMRMHSTPSGTSTRTAATQTPISPVFKSRNHTARM